VRGRRLPSGRDNAVARYRIGGGPSGNVEANRLTLFQRPAPGSDRVRNPVAATGGVAAAGVEELRVPAGYAIASLERVVTASDLEDYVRAWPGVAKVDVVRKPRRLRRVPMSFVVTYAMHAGDALDVATLSETLQRVGAAGWEIAVVPCRRRLFEIEARLYVARDVEPGEVVASARRTLVDGLSFERRALRQDVLASEIVASIQGVRGVRAVSLDVFHERGTVTRVVERITGDDGEPDEGASLLLLDVDRLQLVAVTEEESG
jgi:predicted phage baseplate assembly protein